ncbi:dicarboxylate carrier UCP2-like isoform X2 [Clytia hemisphaerica]|eukprot:TCONS_00022383-protein
MVANQQTTPAPVMVEPAKSYFTTTFIKMFSAGTAASIAEITTIPIDTAKVRLQIQGESSTSIAEARSSLKYRGMIHCIFTISKEEGFSSLYRGLVPGIQRQYCFCGVRIGLYDHVRKMYGDTSQGKPKLLVKIAASITTASSAVLMFQPTEVVKIRMQAAGKKLRYTGTLNAYQTIFRQEGLKGLWRGTSTNVTRLSLVNCTEIVIYDYIKSYALYKNWMQDGVPLHFVSALGAGFITVMVASPVDVVKTRYMNSATGSYKNPIHCAVSLLKNNGVTAFYKGFIPSFTRLGSWTIVFFLSYEQIKKYLNA